jgi:hypothetical protein
MVSCASTENGKDAKREG